MSPVEVEVVQALERPLDGWIHFRRLDRQGCQAQEAQRAAEVEKRTRHGGRADPSTRPSSSWSKFRGSRDNVLRCECTGIWSTSLGPGGKQLPCVRQRVQVLHHVPGVRGTQHQPLQALDGFGSPCSVVGVQRLDQVELAQDGLRHQFERSLELPNRAFVVDPSGDEGDPGRFGVQAAQHPPTAGLFEALVDRDDDLGVVADLFW